MCQAGCFYFFLNKKRIPLPLTAPAPAPASPVGTWNLKDTPNLGGDVTHTPLTRLPNPPQHGTLGDSFQLWNHHRGLCFPPPSATPLSAPLPPVPPRLSSTLIQEANWTIKLSSEETCSLETAGIYKREIFAFKTFKL